MANAGSHAANEDHQSGVFLAFGCLSFFRTFQSKALQFARSSSQHLTGCEGSHQRFDFVKKALLGINGKQSRFAARLRKQPPQRCWKGSGCAGRTAWVPLVAGHQETRLAAQH